MAPIILGLSLILALAAVVFHFLSPGNAVTRFLIPRLLPNGSRPKTEIRQAGVSWIIFSAWLITVAIALAISLPKGAITDNKLLTGLLMFVIPVTAVTLQIAGWYYLAIGIFSKGTQIKPGLRSNCEIEPELLERDIHRLGRCTTINLSSLFLVIALPVTEALLKIEPEGTVVLLNVACLITFILTTRRMQYYLMRSVRAMAKFEGKPFPITNLISHHWIFIWRNSYRVRTFYESIWRLRHAKLTPQGQEFSRHPL